VRADPKVHDANRLGQGRRFESTIRTLIVGLIVGAIAKFLMPGNDPGGWIMTIVLGIAGALGMAGPVGWIGSVLGAMLLLFVYRLVKKA